MSIPPRLYLITPERVCARTFAQDFSHACGGGDIAYLQIRAKYLSDAEILQLVSSCRPLAAAHSVSIIVNDSVDLTLRTQADGVHLGLEDDPIPQAKTELPSGAIVGATCHASLPLAIEAEKQGASYVAFGSCFPSKTKPQARRAPLEIFSKWSAISKLPSVAIGGITAGNVQAVVQAGANLVAVADAVWGHAQGPAAAVAELNAAMNIAERSVRT